HLRTAAARSSGVKLSAVPTTAEAVPVPLGFSGVDPSLLQRVNSTLQQHGLKTLDGPVTYSAGSAPISSALNPSPIQPGDSFMGILSSGDVSSWGGGTAAACNGSATIAFGHPFFFDGPTSMGEADGS